MIFKMKMKGKILALMLMCSLQLFAGVYEDSRKIGIQAYNSGKYEYALKCFQSVAKIAPKVNDLSAWIAKCRQKIELQKKQQRRIPQKKSKLEDPFVEVAEKQPDKTWGYGKSGLALVRRNGKYGFVNKEGEYVIPAKYTKVGCGQFDDNYNEDFTWNNAILMSVKENGKWGFVNKKGNSIVPPIYDEVDATSFIDNTPIWIRKGKLYGCVDTLGNVVVPIEYGNEINFYNHNPAKVKKNGKYGFITEDNTKISDFIYDSALVFGWNDDLCPVSMDGKYGYINKKGKLVISHQFDFADSFNHGLAAVVKEGKLGFINEKGREIISYRYNPVYAKDSDGKHLCHSNFYAKTSALVCLEGKWGVIDREGRQLTKFIYGVVYNDAYMSHYVVYKNGKGIYLDRCGNEYTNESDLYTMSDSIMASQGDPNAQFHIGLYKYYNQKKYVEAIPWFEKAASGHCWEAYYFLGLISYYKYGKCSEAYSDAYGDFCFASAYDNPYKEYAAYYVGWMYEHGQFVEKNNKLAIHFYEKANGFKDSKERILKLSSVE